MINMIKRWRRNRARQAFWRASSRIGQAPLEEVLRELDQVDVRDFSPFDVALWLNNRAYVLALQGCTPEALAHLRDAEELLIGVEDPELLIRHEPELLVSCIIGTRGIALLHGGSIDEAEVHLDDALALGMRHLESHDAEFAYVQRFLAAERLWWLAMIAEKRGDAEHRMERLRRASEFAETPYGEKARQALGNPAR